MIARLAAAGIPAVGDDLAPSTWHYGPTRPDPQTLGPVRDAQVGMDKPIGALWSAPALPAASVAQLGGYDAGESVRTTWTQWARNEGLWGPEEGGRTLTVLQGTPGVVVVQIDRLEHMHALATAFPSPHRMRLYSWEAMSAAGIDAVHLTDAGATATKMGAASYSDPHAIAFSTWDVESVAWLRPEHLHVGNTRPVIDTQPPPAPAPAPARPQEPWARNADDTLTRTRKILADPLPTPPGGRPQPDRDETLRRLRARLTSA